jgi:hypothetical protein
MERSAVEIEGGFLRLRAQQPPAGEDLAIGLADRHQAAVQRLQLPLATGGAGDPRTGQGDDESQVSHDVVLLYIPAPTGFRPYPFGG